MHKRKYTREQLEFYFKKRMEDLKRVPREEDLSNKDGYPSVKAYTERFGSWQNAVNMFANFDLAKRKCLNCGNVLIKKKKTHKFCSDDCAQKYYQKKSSRYTKKTEKSIRSILNDKCFVCDFSRITEIHCLDNKKESKGKILKAFSKKKMNDYVLLCPNHHMMIHKKLATLKYTDNALIWNEQ